MRIKIGIIGGSGLSNPNIFNNPKEVVSSNHYGSPSDVLLAGQISGVDCVLLARHGRKHTILPSAVNFRANLLALKELGCTHVIVSTACGSLREEIVPGNFVIIDQFIDRTTKRDCTFYDGKNPNFQGILHLPMDTPFCSRTRSVLLSSCLELGYKVHDKGTMVTVEGPRFSSKAESHMFRQWGGDVINMTTVPEVILARELGLCYAAVAMATDYDCWKSEGEPVSVEKVMQTFRENAKRAVSVLRLSIEKIGDMDWKQTIMEMQTNVQNNIMLPK